VIAAWLALNRELSALKTARESREAGLKLGNRLLHLVVDLEQDGRLAEFLTVAERSDAGAHHACVFGLAGGWLGLDAELVTAAFLRQGVAGLVAACQKFMPLGQSHAATIQWQLYDLIDTLAREQTCPAAATAFAPLVEIASMRHPYLPVRLFIS
jgi:urease accessory protein